MIINILNKEIKSSVCRQQSEVKQKHGEASKRVASKVNLKVRDIESMNHDNLTERGD